VFRKGERFDGIIAALWPVGKILMRAFGNSTFWELLVPMSAAREAVDDAAGLRQEVLRMDRIGNPYRKVIWHTFVFPALVRPERFALGS